MTILSAGGEDVDIASVVGVAITVTLTTTFFRSAWARCGVGNNLSASAADPPINRFLRPLWASAQTSFWVHAQIYLPTTAPTNNAQLLGLLDSAGVARLLVRGTGTAGQLKISTRNAAGTITDLVTSSSGAWATPGVHQFDLFVNYGSSGTVTLYIDSVQIATYSGDITTDGGGQSFQQDYWQPNFIGSTAVYFSEWIVATDDTRPKGLSTLTSSTAGTNQQFTGTASNLAATSFNDANFCYTSTNSQLEEFKPGALPSGTYTVDAVVMSGRALIGASGPQHFDFVTRIGSTEYLSSNFAPTTSFANYGNYIQATNPATSVAFTTGDLAATNFQYGIESVA